MAQSPVQELVESIAQSSPILREYLLINSIVRLPEHVHWVQYNCPSSVIPGVDSGPRIPCSPTGETAPMARDGRGRTVLERRNDTARASKSVPAVDRDLRTGRNERSERRRRIIFPIPRLSYYWISNRRSCWRPERLPPITKRTLCPSPHRVVSRICAAARRARVSEVQKQERKMAG